jgi:hypothetical protein
MDEAEAQARIEEDTQWQSAPALSGAEIARLLVRALTVDAAGLNPGDTGYVDTWTDRSVKSATAVGWQWKAGKAIALTDVAVGDVRVSGRGNLHGYCLQMARRFGGGQIASIGTLTTPTVMSEGYDLDLLTPGLREPA